MSQSVFWIVIKVVHEQVIFQRAQSYDTFYSFVLAIVQQRLCFLMSTPLHGRHSLGFLYKCPQNSSKSPQIKQVNQLYLREENQLLSNIPTIYGQNLDSNPDLSDSQLYARSFHHGQAFIPPSALEYHTAFPYILQLFFYHS